MHVLRPWLVRMPGATAGPKKGIAAGTSVCSSSSASPSTKHCGRILLGCISASFDAPVHDEGILQ